MQKPESPIPKNLKQLLLETKQVPPPSPNQELLAEAQRRSARRQRGAEAAERRAAVPRVVRWRILRRLRDL